MSIGSSANDPVKVLFVAGTGRSGSTVISNVLGQLPGCLSVGEVRYTWGRGLADNELCGCGQPFASCPLWTAVMDEVRLTQPDLDGAAIAARLDRRLRIRSVPMMQIRRLMGRPTILPHRDDAAILAVYRALAHRDGVQQIVDSSKLPPYAMLLSSLPGVDVHLVHVVRDPRATAFSWRRKKLTREPGQSTMPQLENWRSAVIWLLWNLMIAWWWQPEQRILVRYEDFADDPQRELDRVAAAVGTRVPDGLIDSHDVRMLPTHSVAGNPDRLDAGVITLHNDDEWMSAMGAVPRLLVVAMTFPGLRRFGYAVRVHRRRPRTAEHPSSPLEG